MPATRLLARRDAVAVACVRDLRQGFHGDQAGLEDLLIRPALPGELAKNRQILLPEFARPRWWCHPRPALFEERRRLRPADPTLGPPRSRLAPVRTPAQEPRRQIDPRPAAPAQHLRRLLARPRAVEPVADVVSRDFHWLPVPRPCPAGGR